MGSMGGMMFKCTRSEMFTILNSTVDNKIKDDAQYGAADDNKKDLNEECSVDKVASVKDLEAGCSSSHGHVPTRPRTPRFCFGLLTCDSEGVDDYGSADQVIVDENNSRKSKKGSRDEDYVVCNDGSEEEQSSSKKKKQDYIVSEEEQSSKKQQDHVVSDEDFEESSKKKQKNVEKKRTVPRKAGQVYNLPTDLPQNLQEYISGLNLEVPPLFVAQKLLTPTDVDSHQSRLLLPKSLINAEFFDNFLTNAEKEMLETTEAVEVNLVDDKLREFNNLRLAKWKMSSSLEYALRKGWNTVVEENNLEPLKVSKDSKDKIVVMKEDDLWTTDVVVLVWCFRRESEIWLALHTQAMAELDILGVRKDGNGKRYITGYF